MFSKNHKNIFRKKKDIWPVVIVGGGPAGLVMAISLAKQNIQTVLIDKKTNYCSGSRAICFSEKTIEIFQRLGVADLILDKGEKWTVSKTFFKNEMIAEINYSNALSEERFSPYINLQQYHLEDFLRKNIKKFDSLVDLWGCELMDINQDEEFSLLTVRFNNQIEKIKTRYLIAADGVHSTVRKLMGLDFPGKFFEEKFLVADVKFDKLESESQRKFWFDPPFNQQKTALMLKQPDDIWRIDFQLGWNADDEKEKSKENIRKRIQSLIGEAVSFEIVWASVYSFQARRLEKFLHNNTFFIGDSAHQFSPFGARGANSGIQDADNLSWKLGLVIKELCHIDLLESYHVERASAADINIKHTNRSLNFISPRSEASRNFRDAVLHLSKHFSFAQQWINSGRLSTPVVYCNSVEQDSLESVNFLGHSFPDFKVFTEKNTHWIKDLIDNKFLLFCYELHEAEIDAILNFSNIKNNHFMEIVIIKNNYSCIDKKTFVFKKADQWFVDQFDIRAGNIYLIRPDWHLSATWSCFNEESIIKKLSDTYKFKGNLI